MCKFPERGFSCPFVIVEARFKIGDRHRKDDRFSSGRSKYMIFCEIFLGKYVNESAQQLFAFKSIEPTTTVSDTLIEHKRNFFSFSYNSSCNKILYSTFSGNRNIKGQTNKP